MKGIWSGLVLGIVIGIIVISLGGLLAIQNGWIPARADEPSGGFERWAAHTALKAVLNREASGTSPLPADEPNLLAGAKVYASNCSGCHGSPKDPTPSFAKGFNPPPTLFANGDMVTDDPEGWTYWKIDHGIRFTGMPAFNTMLSKKEMWQVTAFLQHMDKLPPKVNDYWKGGK